MAKLTSKELAGIEYMGLNPYDQDEYIADTAKGYSFDTEYGITGFATYPTKQTLINNIKGSIVYHDDGDVNNNNVTNVLTNEKHVIDGEGSGIIIHSIRKD